MKNETNMPIDKKDVESEEKLLNSVIADKITDIIGVELVSRPAFDIVRGAFPNRLSQAHTPQYEVDGQGKDWPYGFSDILRKAPGQLVEALQNMMKREGAAYAILSPARIQAEQEAWKYRTTIWFDILLPSKDVFNIRPPVATKPGVTIHP